MFIPLVLCDSNVFKIVTELFTFSSYCLLFIASFLYCMWLPIWRIKLYNYAEEAAQYTQ